MRAVSKKNFSSANYGKFIGPQGKRSWSFRTATKKKEKCWADPCCDWDTFGPRWKCSFKLWIAQQCGASSYSYDELSLHGFFLGFPKLHVEVWFFFVLFNFVWVLTIFLDPYNHDSLLSSQSIGRRRSSSDLNSQPTASQPYLLATRVLECPQSFTSFLVIHFYLAYFPVWLFRYKQYEMMFKTIWNGVIIIASHIRLVIHLL